MRISKYKWIVLLLSSITFVSCSKEDSSTAKHLKVTLSSPTVKPDGSLSLNATARFDAKITDPVGDLTLTYEWSLLEARGTLIVENQAVGNQTQSTNPYVSVRGDKAGIETIRVKVLNKETGKSLGEDLLTFEITVATSTSSCFDEPLLFFRNNLWDSPVITAIGLESDTRKITQLSPQNWLFDITKDGYWFLRQDYSDIKSYSIWMDACDGSERKKLTEGLQIFSPTFGPNDKYVYFSELISYPEQTQDPRARELARVNIETGEKVFISSFRVFSGKPQVSPDGKWIAFEREEEVFNANGTLAEIICHLAVMPSNGGPAQLIVQLPVGELTGFDWSPDSEHLIFNWYNPSGSNDNHTNGIYKVQRSVDGKPFLVFAEPKSDGRPIYYANGTRIAFNGSPSGNTTQIDIWSIDANGGDLQRFITKEKYNVFLQFIWEP